MTFRLAGTLPRDVLLRFKAERNAIMAAAQTGNRPLTWNEQKDLFRWYSSRVDRFLDAGSGDCWLKQPKIADIVSNALRFHAGERFDLHAWIVMPNHVHAVVRPFSNWTLSQILKSWKGFTAREANRVLNRTGTPFWQVESYDHLIRDNDDRYRCCHYIAMNAVNAGLCQRPEDWPWSSVSSPTA